MPTPPAYRHRMRPAFWIVAGLSLVLTGLWLIQPASAERLELDGGNVAEEVEEHVHYGQNDTTTIEHDEHHGNPLAEIPFELRLDLRKAYASPLGEMVMRYVREAKPNVDELMAGVTDTIGLDVRTAIGEVVLRGEGMNEMDLQLVADLGDTTGKLEGWMLTLPGYDSDEIDDQTLLHTFLIGDEEHHEHRDGDTVVGHDGRDMHRVWAAMPKARDGRITLVASFDEGDTVEMAEAVVAGDPVDDAPGLGGDEVFALRMDELGEHGLPEGAPGSAVFESVETLTLKLGSGRDVTANVSMSTTSPARARQVSQLLQGMIALGQLVAIEEPEAQPLADFLKEVRVELTETGDEAAVSASFRSSHEKVEEWIEFLMENAH